jgi:hypothetical protein
MSPISGATCHYINCLINELWGSLYFPVRCSGSLKCYEVKYLEVLKHKSPKTPK